jgi:hypothetical protein
MIAIEAVDGKVRCHKEEELTADLFGRLPDPR